MEAQEEVTTQNIVKGKRTKRQRVQSPIPFALTTNSSSGDGFIGDDCTDGTIKIWSPTSSNELLFQDNATEEEEDMANCLILLAQGHSRDHDLKNHHLHQGNIDSEFYINNNDNNNFKFNSRRFLETGSLGSGKAGYYVYECKTCSRTFPSFQALGGHRASHKKPKAMNNNIFDREQKAQLALSSDEKNGHYKKMSSLSLQLSNTNAKKSMYQSSKQNNKSKIHECSICGAEFTSGQALGGHMRRHRGPIGGGNNSVLSLTPLAIEFEEPQKERNLLSLDLDLNFPAPEDEKLMHFASKHQQQQQQKEKKSPSLVFLSPTLVDCHY